MLGWGWAEAEPGGAGLGWAGLRSNGLSWMAWVEAGVGWTGVVWAAAALGCVGLELSWG